MGARDWMLVYAEREVQPVLASAPALDRDATWVCHDDVCVKPLWS